MIADSDDEQDVTAIDSCPSNRQSEFNRALTPAPRETTRFHQFPIESPRHEAIVEVYASVNEARAWFRNVD